MDDKPFSVIFLSLYCFFLALASLFSGFYIVVANAEANLSGNDSYIPVITIAVLSLCQVGLGIGILQVRQWAWKTMFFLLTICLSTFISLIFITAILLVLSFSQAYLILEGFHITSTEWFLLLSFILSQIVALRYLTRGDVVVHFGVTGDIVRPF